MSPRDRNVTPALGLGACGYCGGEVVPIPDCAVPSHEQLKKPPWSMNCVASPRWRWCPKTFFFAAWYGPGAPPESMPGMSLPLVPR